MSWRFSFWSRTALSRSTLTLSLIHIFAAESVYLINLDSDMVICEQNADKPIEPSSLAQLMTVVLALEKVENPENAMATMRGYIQDEMYRQNVSLGGIRLAGLYKDEEISIQKLMYAVMIRDANEAAMMIADYVGDGSVPYFVEMMKDVYKRQV